MKVVVIGGGISGLASYLFLQKLLSNSLLSPESAVEIVLYETYDSGKHDHGSGSSSHGEPTGLVSDIIGGALGVAPNGLRVLRDLDPSVFTAAVNQGYTVSHFWIRNAHGWNLAQLPATDHGNPQLHTVLVSRQGLWNQLRDQVPDDVIVRKRVTRVTCGDNQRPRVSFADGSPDVEADLVVGADGVKSVARKAVLQRDGENAKYNAVYEGLVGVGGFIPTSELSPEQVSGRLTMTFGPQGFFGYGVCTSTLFTPASACESPTNETETLRDDTQATETLLTQAPNPAGPQAVWWSTYSIADLPDTKTFDRDDIRRQLRSRHSTWADPTIRRIVSTAAIDSIYPTWTTPDLPTWGRNGVVLVGDAAHALQPSSGQGASQALEDAQMLALLLKHYIGLLRPSSNGENDDTAIKNPPDDNSNAERNAINQAVKAYFQLRSPRVKRIADRAKYTGDMKRKKGLVGEWLTYFFIWLIGKLPSDSFTEFVVNYSATTEVKKFFAEKKQ